MINDRFIEAHGVRTWVVDRGAGPCIVLIHGADFAVDSWFTWLRQIGPLSRRFRVVAFDQMGFGRTDLPADGRYRDRLERADHAVAVLEALGLEDVALVGHSEGSFTAARVAITHPTHVSRLVLMTSSGTAPAFGDGRDRAWQTASDALYDFSGPPPAEAAFLARLRARCRAVDAELEAAAVDAYGRARARGQYELLARLPTSAGGGVPYTQLQADHIHPHLTGLVQPVLLLWSRDDPSAPVERGRLLSDMIPRADFCVLADAGHMVMLDRAREVTAMLETWLAPDR